MLTPSIVTYIANETILAGCRVKFVAGSVTAVELADAADVEIGTALLHSGQSSYTPGYGVAVQLVNTPGSRTCNAAGAFAAGATLRRMDGGLVDDTGVGDIFGIALEAATVAGDLVDVLCLPNMLVTAADGSITSAKLANSLAGGSDGLGMLRVARATFDPSANIGERTIAAHPLGVTIPDDAIVVGGFIEVNTTFTSPTDAGTIAIHVESAGDIRAAVAISTGTSWDAGKQAIIPKAHTPETTGVKTSEARLVTATVAVEPLTAG